MGQIFVYKINDCEWWAGADLESIKTAFQAETGVDPESDEGFSKPQRLSPAYMDMLQYATDEDQSVYCSFAEQLARLVAKGQSFPCPFAMTDF